MENEIPEEYLMEDTPYSTRNQNGLTTFFNTVEEAITDFIGYEGYRLSIKIKGSDVHFYRDELPVIPEEIPGSLSWFNPSARNEYQSKIIVEAQLNEI